MLELLSGCLSAFSQCHIPLHARSDRLTRAVRNLARPIIGRDKLLESDVPHTVRE